MVRVKDRQGLQGWLGRHHQGSAIDQEVELFGGGGGGGGGPVLTSRLLLSAASPLIRAALIEQQFCSGCTQKTKILLPWADASTLRYYVEIIQNLWVFGRLQHIGSTQESIDKVKLKDLMHQLGVPRSSQAEILSLLPSTEPSRRVGSSKRSKSPSRGRKECWLVSKLTQPTTPHKLTPAPDIETAQEEEGDRRLLSDTSKPSSLLSCSDDGRNKGEKRKLSECQDERFAKRIPIVKAHRLDESTINRWLNPFKVSEHNGLHNFSARAPADNANKSADYLPLCSVATGGSAAEEDAEDYPKIDYNALTLDAKLNDSFETAPSSKPFVTDAIFPGFSFPSLLAASDNASDPPPPETSDEANDPPLSTSDEAFDPPLANSDTTNPLTSLDASSKLSYVCYICKSQYSTRQTIYYHYASDHFKVEMSCYSGLETCPFCDKKLKRKNSLAHVLDRHNLLEDFLPSQHVIPKRHRGRPKLNSSTAPVSGGATNLSNIRRRNESNMLDRGKQTRKEPAFLNPFYEGSDDGLSNFTHADILEDSIGESIPALACFGDNPAEVDNAKEEVDAAHEDVETAQDEVDAAWKEVGTAQEQVDTGTKKVNTAQDLVDIGQKKIEAALKKLDTDREKVYTARKEVKAEEKFTKLEEDSAKNSYSCYICQATFSGTDGRVKLYVHYANAHFKTAVEEVLNGRHCLICGKSHISPSHALRHVVFTHKIIESLIPAENHVMKKRIRVKNVNCGLCDHVTSSRSYLYEHYACRHFREAIADKFDLSNGCPLCDKPLKDPTRVRLLSHLGVAHRVVEQFLEPKHHLPQSKICKSAESNNSVVHSSGGDDGKDAPHKSDHSSAIKISNMDSAPATIRDFDEPEPQSNPEVKVMSTKTKKKLKCKDCSFSTSWRCNIIRHCKKYNHHYLGRPYLGKPNENKAKSNVLKIKVFSCKDCSFTSKQRYNLKVHCNKNNHRYSLTSMAKTRRVHRAETLAENDQTFDKAIIASKGVDKTALNAEDSKTTLTCYLCQRRFSSTTHSFARASLYFHYGLSHFREELRELLESDVCKLCNMKFPGHNIDSYVTSKKLLRHVACAHRYVEVLIPPQYHVKLGKVQKTRFMRASNAFIAKSGLEKSGNDPEKLGTDLKKPIADLEKLGKEIKKPGKDLHKPGKNLKKLGMDLKIAGMDLKKPAKDLVKPTKTNKTIIKKVRKKQRDGEMLKHTNNSTKGESEKSHKKAPATESKLKNSTTATPSATKVKPRNYRTVKDKFCRLCDFVTYSRGYLYEHYANRHYKNEIAEKCINNSGLPADFCTICNKQLKCSGKLISHVGVVHNMVEEFLPVEFWVNSSKGNATWESACEVYIDNPEQDEEEAMLEDEFANQNEFNVKFSENCVEFFVKSENDQAADDATSVAGGDETASWDHLESGVDGQLALEPATAQDPLLTKQEAVDQSGVKLEPESDDEAKEGDDDDNDDVYVAGVDELLESDVDLDDDGADEENMDITDNLSFIRDYESDGSRGISRTDDDLFDHSLVNHINIQPSPEENQVT